MAAKIKPRTFWCVYYGPGISNGWQTSPPSSSTSEQLSSSNFESSKPKSGGGVKIKALLRSTNYSPSSSWSWNRRFRKALAFFYISSSRLAVHYRNYLPIAEIIRADAKFAPASLSLSLPAKRLIVFGDESFLCKVGRKGYCSQVVGSEVYTVDVCFIQYIYIASLPICIHNRTVASRPNCLCVCVYSVKVRWLSFWHEPTTKRVSLAWGKSMNHSLSISLRHHDQK